MLGASALLFVHPAIVFNSLNAPGVFFLLKLVAVFFFSLTPPLSFSSLSPSVVGSCWFFIIERVVAWVEVKVLQVSGDCCDGCFVVGDI